MEFEHVLIAVALCGLFAGWLLPRAVLFLVLSGLGAAAVYWLYLDSKAGSDPFANDSGEANAWRLVGLIIFGLMWALWSAGAQVGAWIRRLGARDRESRSAG